MEIKNGKIVTFYLAEKEISIDDALSQIETDISYFQEEIATLEELRQGILALQPKRIEVKNESV